MPRFDVHFATQAQLAIEIVEAGEVTRASGGKIAAEWTVKKLEALYELAYLRTFAAWEVLLESVFYRSLCGYASSAGQEKLISGSYFATIKDAEAAVAGKKPFLLWHNPKHVVTRCQNFIQSGKGCPALQEAVITSNVSRLVDFAAIRHRIAHNHEDARKNFDQATLGLAGRTYPASRPGKFLRDLSHSSSSPPRKWLDVTVAELTGLAQQMV